jgi:hypothetical protein
MDDIVEDARRETEVLLSIWENQNNGRSHDHGYNGCNMFVPLTRPDSSLSEDTEDCGGECRNVRNDLKGAVGVRWSESDIFIGKTRESRSLSSVSPGDVGVQEFLDEETSLGARRITWGSSVGDNDRGVFEAPKFFEAVPGN